MDWNHSQYLVSWSNSDDKNARRKCDAEQFERGRCKCRKMISVPTIFNNLLWYGIAKENHQYYCQYYSILDKNPENNTIYKFADGKELLGADSAHHIVKTLDWFGDGYTSVLNRNGDTLQWNDLRFGSLSFKFEKPEDFVFHFDLIKSPKGLQFASNRKRPPLENDQMVKFWMRAFGKQGIN